MTATQDEAGGLSLSFLADFKATLGKLEHAADQYEKWSARRNALFQSMHQVPITPGQITLSGGAGILQSTELLGPKQGKCWSIRRLTAVGFSAGTVTAYITPAAATTTTLVGETLVPWASAGTFTFGRGEMLLMPGDFMAFAAATITGTVTIYGRADQLDLWLLPDYLL